MVGPAGDFQDLFELILPAIPSILAWLAILIIALVNWRRYPGPSLLVLLAALLNLLSHSLFSLLYFWIIQEGEFWMERLLNWVRTFLEVGSAALMVIAVYAWRTTPGGPRGYLDHR